MRGTSAGRPARDGGHRAVTCASCGATNEAGRRFCGDCGSPLQSACPACGAANRPGARFCGDCGSPLAAGAAPPQSAGGPETGPGGPGDPPSPAQFASVASAAPMAPVAERRLVSILFADLVGSTTLADGRDPEETRELLSRYFDVARDVITRYGGVVEKFIGDAVMAVWGAPTAREDDAERSVRAALELVDAVRTLGPDVRLRAGVLTGEAAVTLGAQGQGMVAGDLVNTASRLQSVALPDTVLVGETTMRASSASIAFEPAGDKVLKGKELPVAAYRALRVVAERGGRGRADTLEAPFVGRHEEIRSIKDQYHVTGREQRTRLVSVVGPPGIGKSRLAWELEKYLDGLVETIWWHHGRSPSYGEGIAFWALGEMIRGRAGLAEGDDESTTRTRIAETLARFVPDEEERRWMEPMLLALLGFGELRAGGSEQLFAAWRTFFERISATGTVVLVFEDIQWADEGLLDFIDHLQEWSRGNPIYVLALSRPELLERRPSWGAGKRHFTNLFLEPLSTETMHELLAGMVPGLPERAAAAIVGRADGVPLYAVETVRMLIEAGRLVRDVDGAYRPIGDLSTLAVPDTLHALIAARLDALDPVARSVLADASVLGQSFVPAALVSVSGRPVDELDPVLRALVRRELLVLEADPRSPERGQYAFVQSLIREVAYGTIAHRDRLRRHLAAALYFESLGTDELAGALASHYLAAYRNASPGDEEEALAAQARVALRLAADRAIALGSYAQAVEFLVQAVEVSPEPADRADLLERAGESASALGRHDDAERYLREALAFRSQTDDRSAAARTTAALGRALLTGYRTDAAVQVLESGATEFADLGDDPDLAAVGGQLARAHLIREDNRKAVEMADRVLTVAERLDLIPVIADTLVTKGAALVPVGRAYEGIGAMQAGLLLAQANGLTKIELRAHVNIGSVEMDREPVRSLAASRAGLALAHRLGQVNEILVSNMAETAVRIGEWDLALEHLTPQLMTELDRVDRIWMLVPLIWIRALRGEDVSAELADLEGLIEGITDAAVLASRAAGLAIAALAAGDLDAAYAEAERTARLSPGNAAEAWRRAGRAALWARDVARARAARESIIATGLHGSFIVMSIDALGAAIDALDAHQARSVAAYRSVLERIDDLGLPWERALVGIDMATLLGPDDPDARAAAIRAREILVGLGARPFIERLDAAMGATDLAREAARGPAAAHDDGSVRPRPTEADVPTPVAALDGPEWASRS